MFQWNSHNFCLIVDNAVKKSDAAQYSTDDTFRPTNGDNGLYAVNKLNHYAEIESQYTELGEKGQRKDIPVRNNDSSHTEVRMQF